MTDAEKPIELTDLLDTKDLVGMRLWLAEHQPYEIADALARLPPERAAVPFRLLDKDRELEVFEELDPGQQQA
ncbi:MAG TPA: magnesium transporter, partial [Thermobifida alba]|nr:magnesium transporter [Thermobifida alba]